MQEYGFTENERMLHTRINNGMELILERNWFLVTRRFFDVKTCVFTVNVAVEDAIDQRAIYITAGIVCNEIRRIKTEEIIVNLKEKNSNLSRRPEKGMINRFRSVCRFDLQRGSTKKPMSHV